MNCWQIAAQRHYANLDTAKINAVRRAENHCSGTKKIEDMMALERRHSAKKAYHAPDRGFEGEHKFMPKTFTPHFISDANAKMYIGFGASIRKDRHGRFVDYQGKNVGYLRSSFREEDNHA